MELGETMTKEGSGDVVVETDDEGSKETKVMMAEYVESQFHDIGEEVGILLLRSELRLTEVIEIVEDVRWTFAMVRWDGGAGRVGG